MQRLHPVFITLALFLALCAGRLEAAVYNGAEFTYHQPDGSSFVVRLWGDERSVRTETTDGWAIAEDGQQWWCYARLGTDGLVASSMRVGAGDPTTLGITKGLRPTKAQTAALRLRRQAELGIDERGQPRDAALRAAGGIQPAPPAATTTGDKHGLTLMIKFSDFPEDGLVMSVEQIRAFCNVGSPAQPGNYTDFENNGSVYQYFYDNSKGLLSFTNHVVDYLQPPKPRSYYAAPSGGAGQPANGERAEELIRWALGQMPLADLQAADADNDMIVDAVSVFYAGTCPNSWAQGLWPHKANLAPFWTGHGYTVRSYQISDMKDHLAIGTFCHECGHMLCNFPDLYDYDYDSVGGAGIFSLMAWGNDGGSYRGDPGKGTNPVRVDGYLATAAGWRTVIDLNAATPLTIETVTAESATIYRYLNPNAPTEYFLIENRRNINRDATLPGSGLAIWHVDEQGDRDDQRFYKNALHQNYELALVQADNRHDFELTSDVSGQANDLWFQGNSAPWYRGLFWDSLGLTTTENNARWWDNTASGMILDRFSAPGASMTFTIGPPTLGFASATASIVEGNAGVSYATLTVTRHGAGAASVDWATSDDTATIAGLDYRAASGTLTWASGEIGDKTISIPILGDTTPENNETILVNLLNPTGTALGTALCTLTIVNDDGAAPAGGSLQFATYSTSLVEGAGGAITTTNLTVNRVGGTTGAASVHWSIVPGTATVGDYSDAAGDLTWADGDATPQTIAITTVNDTLPENDETFSVVLTAPTDPTAPVIAPLPDRHDVTITNDDTVVGFLMSSLTVDEPVTGTATVYVPVHRTGAPNGQVTVDYTCTDGTAVAPGDYTAVNASPLTFPDGNADQAIAIQVNADAISGNRRTFTITLSNPTTTLDSATLGASVIQVEIRDPTLAIKNSSNGTASNGGLAGACGAGAAGALLAGAAILGLRLRRRR